MRTLFFIPLVLVSLFSSPSWGLDIGDLVIRDGLYYKKFTDVPFTGEVDGLAVGSFVDGRMNGPWTLYHQNGQLAYKGKMIFGKEDGFWVHYGENGKLKFKGNYKDGKREGYWESYFDNGQIAYKGSYKDGIDEGAWEIYSENGQLYQKGNFKNGKKEGFWIRYNSDQTVNEEHTGTFRNGVKVSN